MKSPAGAEAHERLCQLEGAEEMQAPFFVPGNPLSRTRQLEYMLLLGMRHRQSSWVVHDALTLGRAR